MLKHSSGMSVWTNPSQHGRVSFSAGLRGKQNVCRLMGERGGGEGVGGGGGDLRKTGKERYVVSVVEKPDCKT